MLFIFIMLLQGGTINIIIYMIVEYEVRFFCGHQGESIGLSCKTRKHFDMGVVVVQRGYMNPGAIGRTLKRLC